MARVLLFLVMGWTSVALANKPMPGPAVGKEKDVQEQPKAEEDPVHTKYVQMVEARDRADLARAAFEKTHRPGAIADDARKAFDEVVQAYRTAIDLDPRSEIADYCRQRLAGAYTYIGDFDAGLRIHTEAVNVAVGPLRQVRACMGAGYHVLQSMHKPQEARRWFERAAGLLDKIEDDQERAKWNAAVEQGIARCTP